MAEGRKEEIEGISIVEAPFFDLLISSLALKNEAEINKAKDLIHILLPLLQETAEINNFWNRPAEQRQIEGQIEDEVRYSKIPGVSEKAAELTTELMKLAKNRKAELQ